MDVNKEILPFQATHCLGSILFLRILSQGQSQKFSPALCNTTGNVPADLLPLLYVYIPSSFSPASPLLFLKSQALNII